MRAFTQIFGWTIVTALSSGCAAPSGDGAGTAGSAGTISSGGNPDGGGTSTGGASTGGASTGGASTGGASTGGASTGGASTGGASTGGASTGGASTGGASTGGSNGSGGSGACNGTSGGAGTTQTPGTWVDVTPSALGGAYVNSILADPARHSDLWVNVDHQGTWKSTDFGVTWNKVSVGAMATGTGAWSAAIELNPCRDPGTPPAMYIAQGYGALGIWKSTDGGVNWTNVWNNNIFASDGVTNISSDVGSDIAQIEMVDPADKDHLITCLHGYFGSGGNNGVFETTDGGKKWVVHKTTTFTFEPHNSLLRALDAATWMVTPGTISSSMTMYRTTDGGASWANLGDAPQRGMGHILARAGSTLYTGADYNSGVAKSTDSGLTWKQIANTGGHVTWVVTTATSVYASDGIYSAVPTIRHASLSNDSSWSGEAAPSGMHDNGSFAVPIVQGPDHVIVAAQHTAGIWRYVEP